MCNTQMMMMTAGIAAIALTGGAATPVVLGAETAAGAGLGIGAMGTASTASAISASTLMTGAAAATSAYAQVESGKTANKIAEFNAASGRQAAKDALDQGVIAADRKAAEVRQFQGSQNAAMGASGIDPTTGTASRVMDQTAVYGAADAQRVLDAYRQKAWGFEQGAQGDLMQGAAAKQAGYLNGFGTLLSGAAAIRARNGVYSKTT